MKRMKWMEFDSRLHQSMLRGSRVTAAGCQDKLPAPVSGMAFAASGHVIRMGSPKGAEALEPLQRHSFGLFTDMGFHSNLIKVDQTLTVA